MEQKKTNKKKLVIALALLALIVVASVITTVVLVLAANQQNVQSNVTVTYSVTDVSATVYGRYGQKPVVSGDNVPGANKIDNMTMMKNSDGTFNGLTFTPDENNNTPKTMAPEQSIVLSSKSNYAVFEYEFLNNATDTTNAFSIGLEYSGNADANKNISVGYKSSSSKITDFGVYNRADSSWASDWNAANLSSLETAGKVVLFDAADNSAVCAAESTVYVYVIVAISNLSQAANFSGAFNFNLVAKTV